MDFHGHADRVAVILQQKQYRQFQVARGIERFPKLAFAGRAVAQRDINNFVVTKVLDALLQLLDQLDAITCFGASDRLQKLRTGRRRLRDDVEFLMAPVRRHLTSVRSRIRFGAHRLQKLFERRHAELQTERAIAIVGIEPIVTRLQAHAGRNQNRLMTGAADLEENPVLALHLNFFVVEPPREIHRAIDFQHFFAAETRAFGRPNNRDCGRRLRGSRFRALRRGHGF